MPKESSRSFTGQQISYSVNFRKFKTLGFLFGAFLLPLALFAQQPMNDDERKLFDSVNLERAKRSLSPLRWDETLAKAALLHARRMAFYNVVEHQLSGEPDLEARLTEAGARFGLIAENIAVGANSQMIHDGWMDSPGHRSNILNSRITSVGIAAVRNRSGLFAVEDFTLAVDELSVEQQEKRVEAVLTQGGWQISRSKEDARKACETNLLGLGVQSVSMVRYEDSDLTKLPEEVEKKLRSKAKRIVAVGACPAGNRGPGFARFRIALLLF